MAVENSYTSCELFPGLTEIENITGSLYDILSRAYQCEIVGATRTIEAVFTRPEENEILGLEGQQPGLLIETVAVDGEHRPVEYGKSLYRGDRYKFVVQQTRD
jgi:GntR family transcriptional regulator